jgi:hypothetical protein
MAPGLVKKSFSFSFSFLVLGLVFRERTRKRTNNENDNLGSGVKPGHRRPATKLARNPVHPYVSISP